MAGLLSEAQKAASQGSIMSSVAGQYHASLAAVGNTTGSTSVVQNNRSTLSFASVESMLSLNMSGSNGAGYAQTMSSYNQAVVERDEVANYLVDTSSLISAMNTMGDAGKTMSSMGNGVNNAYDAQAVFTQVRLTDRVALV